MSVGSTDGGEAGGGELLSRGDEVAWLIVAGGGFKVGWLLVKTTGTPVDKLCWFLLSNSSLSSCSINSRCFLRALAELEVPCSFRFLFWIVSFFMPVGLAKNHSIIIILQCKGLILPYCWYFWDISRKNSNRKRNKKYFPQTQAKSIEKNLSQNLSSKKTFSSQNNEINK